MSSIPGAWIADRITGTRGATLLGAVLIIIGHICLSLPFALFGLFSSMFFIIIGSGLMKPNISNIVGRLYPENDTRIDAGFVIFYMSVNLGALISPIILQHFVDIRNFHGGFLLAAIGMALGLVWYLLFNRKNLGSVGMKPTNPLSKEEKRKYGMIIGIIVAIVIIVLLVTYYTHTLSFDLISNTVLVLGVALPIIYFTTMLRSKDVTDVERSRVKAFIPLFILGMLFWTTRFGEALFQSINPLFILLFAPVISMIWLKMGKKQPSLAIKFGIGTLLAGLSYILIGLVGLGYGHTQFSVNWVILSYVICVIGELCLSPTGNSAAVKLAPKAFNAQMMSVWLLTNASAQAINGTLVKLIKPLGQTNYFIFLGTVAIVITLIILVFSPKITKAMKGIH